MDEGYVHKIRVLEDIQSGAVRIAAARGDGSSDVTVWTAFGEYKSTRMDHGIADQLMPLRVVTEHILRPDFMARGSDGTVTLRGIRRLSFSDVFETKYFNHFPLKFRAREGRYSFLTQAQVHLTHVSQMPPSSRRRSRSSQDTGLSCNARVCPGRRVHIGTRTNHPYTAIIPPQTASLSMLHSHTTESLSRSRLVPAL